MLVVFGALNLDIVFPVVDLPRAGETLRSEGGAMQSGGKGANQAVAAARDDAEVSFVGTVGRDLLADATLARMQAAGVRLDGVERAQASTARSAILIDQRGYTTVVTHAGANRLSRAAQVRDRLLGPHTTLLLQMETDVGENVRLIARARESGARVVLNFSPPCAISAASLEAVDLLVANSNELAWLGEHLGTGNNPASLRGALGVTMVRMLGVQGAEAVSADGYWRMPATPVDMRDTSAAADCFTGVLAAAFDRRLGTAAALSVTELGTQNSMPARRQIDAALSGAPHPTDE